MLCTVGMTKVCCFCWFPQHDFTSKLKELAARVSRASEPMLSFKPVLNPKEHQRLKGDCSFVISVQVGVIYSRPGRTPFSVLPGFHTSSLLSFADLRSYCEQLEDFCRYGVEISPDGELVQWACKSMRER